MRASTSTSRVALTHGCSNSQLVHDDLPSVNFTVAMYLVKLAIYLVNWVQTLGCQGIPLGTLEEDTASNDWFKQQISSGVTSTWKDFTDWMISPRSTLPWLCT